MILSLYFHLALSAFLLVLIQAGTRIRYAATRARVHLGSDQALQLHDLLLQLPLNLEIEMVNRLLPLPLLPHEGLLHLHLLLLTHLHHHLLHTQVHLLLVVLLTNSLPV